MASTCLTLLLILAYQRTASSATGDVLFATIYGDPSGTSCSTSLDCGSNIKYEYCASKSGKECKSSDSDCKCIYCSHNSQCDVNHANDECVERHWCEMRSLVDSFDTNTIITIVAILSVSLSLTNLLLY